MMNRIALSLTAHMRNLTGETAAGTTQTVEQYVYARWGWAILPLILLALSLVFLITTIVLNAVRHIPTWRSSALPSLIYSLDEATTAAIAAHGPRLKALEEEAGQHTMAICTDGLWRLEGTRLEKTSGNLGGKRKPFWLIPRRR